jgi:hypothetical protein
MPRHGRSRTGCHCIGPQVDDLGDSAPGDDASFRAPRRHDATRATDLGREEGPLDPWRFPGGIPQGTFPAVAVYPGDKSEFPRFRGNRDLARGAITRGEKDVPSPRGDREIVPGEDSPRSSRRTRRGRTGRPPRRSTSEIARAMRGASLLKVFTTASAFLTVCIGLLLSRYGTSCYGSVARLSRSWRRSPSPRRGREGKGRGAWKATGVRAPSKPCQEATTEYRRRARVDLFRPPYWRTSLSPLERTTGKE